MYSSFTVTVIIIDIPHFYGDSYISYPSINDSLGTVASRIHLELRPNSSDGLMLYNRHISGTDYISLSLQALYSSNMIWVVDQ